MPFSQQADTELQPTVPPQREEGVFDHAVSAGAGTDGDVKKDSGKFVDRLRVNLSDIDPRMDEQGALEEDEDIVAGATDFSCKHIDEEDDTQPFASPPPKNCCDSFLEFCRFIVGVVIPYGGLISSSFNLASATLGAGIISMPSAFNLSGVVMSTIYLIIVTTGTIFSMHLLARVMVRTGITSFSAAARCLLGPGADYFLAALIMVMCFGGSVAYIIAASTLLSPILLSPGSPPYLQTKSGNRLMTSMVWLVFMLPLVIPKHINSLRYVSACGVLFIVYFVICIIVHSCTNGLSEKKHEMQMMRTGNAALEGLGVFLFSNFSQLNAFEIFFECRKRTVFHFTLYTTIAMVGCAILYFLAGFFGYADFGEKVTDSVLKLYDPISEPYIAVGYIGIIIKICAAFALHMIPFRDAIYHIIRWKASEVPYWKHTLVMAIPTTLALICGLFIPSINTVLGLLGSFCGGIIGFIMPALFFMYCGNFSLSKTGILCYIGTYLLLIGGVVAVVFGTVTTIYSTAQNSFA